MPKVKAVKYSKTGQTLMDYFLSSSPLKKQSLSTEGSSSNVLRQATIQSLSRVVSVDHLLRCKAILKDDKTEKIVMISTLKELSEKIPSREVMQSTKIGHVVRKLVKHDDKDVRKHAKLIYDKWRTFFINQSNKTAIDVKCSTSTDNCRRNVRKHLAATLEVSEDNSRIISFEREGFHLCKTMTLHQYKRIMRSIVLKGKNDPELRESILQNTKQTKEIIKMFE